MKPLQIIEYLCLTAGILLMAKPGYSQDPIRKEVRVVKPYQPSLSDAYKITLLPVLDDTVQFKPEYNYTITPKSFNPEYQLRPIRPARMLGEPLPKLYNSLLKLGFGSYWTPFAEVSINNLRSKEHSIGAFGKHMSSQGKVLLENDKEVFGGYSNSEVLLYGKKIFKEIILSGDVGLRSDQAYYYGYDTEIVGDTTLEKKDIKQSFLSLSGEVKIQSGHTDSTRFRYDLGFRYDYFSDKFNMVENGFLLDGRFSKLIGRQFLGTDLLAHYVDKSTGIDSSFNALIKVAPWFMKRKVQWRLKAGLNLSFDITSGNTVPHIYPQAELQFRVIESLLLAYLGVDGKLEMNNYQIITAENPYIIPGLHVKNTDHNMIIYGGFLGNISSETSFKIRASYSLIDDMHFFVNDTNDILRNQFHVEYDDVELKTIYAEIASRPGDHLSVLLKGGYYGYSMSTQNRPWHKPSWDVTLGLKYNLRNKIILSADLFAESKRFAKIYGIADSIREKELDGLVDLNFGIEYRYNKLLSGFLNLYNITSARYYRWNQYSSQRFFILVGFTYAM